MARLVEDQKKGMVAAAEMPDPKSIAKDLVSKGVSVSQVQSMLSSSGLDVEQDNELISEMVALETAEVGNEPLPEPEGDPVVAPEKPSTKSSTATNPQPLPQPESQSMAGTVGMEGFDVDISDGFDLDGINEQVGEALKTQLATVETNTLVNSFLDLEPTAQMEQEEAAYNQAVSQLGEQIYQEALFQGEQRVAEAQTSEEVEQAVAETQVNISKGFIPIPEFKKNWVIKNTELEQDQVPEVDRLVMEQHILAAEAQKRQEGLWKNASVMDIIADFGELVFPVSGIAEEEVIKANNRIDDALTKIANSGSIEEKKATLTALLDDWATQETKLFSNNNSLINSGQIDYLRQALLQGGLSNIEGRMTDAELESEVMSYLNIGLAGAEVGGLASLFKALKARIFPQDKKNLENMYKQLGRIKPLEGTLLLGGQDNLLPYMRNSSNAQKTQYLLRPEKVVQDSFEGDISEKFAIHGVKPEDAALEHVPTPTGDINIGLADLIQDRQNFTSVMFADESLLTMGQRRGLALEKETGNNIRFIPSATGFIKDEAVQDDSFGTFRLVFGEGTAKGFASEEDAVKAAKNNVLGEDYNVFQEKGRWWIEVQQRHHLDVGKDIQASSKPDGYLKQFVLNPLRQLGDDFFRGVFALKAQNRVKSVDLEKKMKKGTTGMSPKVAEVMYKALERGDDDMVEWLTYDEFLKGNNLSDSVTANKAYKKYKLVREAMEEVYQIRNQVFTNKKRNLGYKNIRMDDDEFELGVRTQRGEIEDPDLWSTSDRQAVKRDSIADDDVVMKLDNPIERDGKFYQYVKVEPERVNKLPTELLNKRPGHIDRMYRDAGWTVKVTKQREVGGRVQPYTSTTHIVKTRKQADEILAKVREEDDTIEAKRVAARENSDLDDLFNDTSSAQFSYGASHTRARRDELLKGSDGADATLVDIPDRLERAVRSASRAYDVDIMDTMKARFYETFEDLLEKGRGTEWSNDFGKMLKNDKSFSNSDQIGAKQMHSYIKAFENLENSWVLNAIDAGISALSRDHINANSRAINTAVQKLTSQVYIVGAPLFQIPQNFAQLAYVAMRHPVSGSTAAVQTPFVISAMLQKSPNFKLLGRVLGTSEDVAKDLVKTLKESGLLEVGSADDFLSMTRKSFSSSSRTLTGKAFKAAGGALRLPFSTSQLAQEGTVKLVNIAAYLAEFNKSVVRGKAKYNAATKADLSFQTQKVMNTQNGVDQFFYQNKGSLLSTALQFAQHMNKVFLDVVVDPHVKVLTGKNLGKDAGPLSTTYNRAAFTLAATYAIFGFDGIGGQGAGGSAEDVIRSKFPDASEGDIEFLLEGGYFNSMANSTLQYLMGGEGQGDFTSRMGPGGFADYVNDKLISPLVSLDFSLDMAGPFGGALGQVTDFGLNTVDLLVNTPEMDTSDKVSTALREMAAIVKGFKDYDKALVAKNMQMWPYWSTLSSDMRVSEYEGALALLSVPPSLVQDQMEQMSFGNTSRPEDTERFTELMLRMANRELAAAEEDGSLDPIKFREIMQKWQSYSMSFGDIRQREDIRKVWARGAYSSDTQTYQSYIKKYIDGTEIKDYIEKLQNLKGKATTDQARREIEQRIEKYKLLDTNNEELYR